MTFFKLFEDDAKPFKLNCNRYACTIIIIRRHHGIIRKSPLDRMAVPI